MPSFFINRPIFAWVIAIVIMLAGVFSILKLPVNQYPNIAAPAVSITVVYPGASAQTVQDTVVQVIEQQLNNLDGLRYIAAESNSDGSMSIIVTFDQGTDPDIAQVQVQNKLQLATPLLPEEVQRQGLRVAKYQINFMLVVGLYSEDGSMDDFDLGNYIASNLKDPITRVKGVGDYQLLGAQYAMRIWTDPQKLLSYQMTPQDVIDAVRAENVQVSSGSLGGLPTHEGVQLNATVLGMSRMKTADEFKEILLKVNPDGSQVRLRDVATVGLGAEDFSISGTHNGKPAAAIALRLATGANLLDTVQRVRDTVSELEPFLPPGVKVAYPYDTSPAVGASIHEVVKTLFEGIVLVFLVMYLFMQNLRATLIPTLAVPVVLLGTFGVLAAFGFTINILTMFGMVLAIGLLVDDAIVVVENVERVMVEDKLSPKEATRKSMGQIQGALVGIAMVLSAVFVPMAFFGGATGIIYRQFSITIVSAMALSVLVAMIFTPALCATLLKPIEHGHHEKKGFFGWFNRTFERNADRYKVGVMGIAKRKVLFLGIYALIVGALCWLFPKIPTAFLPPEDQGTMFVQVQMPPNTSAERTQVVLNEVRDYLLKDEAGVVDTAYTVNGFNFAGRGQSSGLLFVTLKRWEERSDPRGTEIFALAQRLQARASQIKDGTVIAIVPPAILEMGNAMGFDFYLQDRAGMGHEKLIEARNQFLQMAATDPVLANVRPNGMNDEPQYQIVIDKEKARALQVSIADINNTMSTAWGSSYVNDFVDRGRVKKVYVQGEINSRISPEDFDKWYVRNAKGEMVKFSSFANGHWTYGSPKLERFNGVSAVEIQGEPAPGYSSGDAMQAVARIVAKLPDGIGLQYTGMSYEERLSGSQAPALYAVSVLIVFLCLAALYESWSVPLAVIMVVPLGVIGAVLATLGRGLANDVFFQVGLLTTVGLSAKNAILIVEFAKALHEQGMPLLQAAAEAARQRLRPIIMTSLAFVLGVLPLAISSGPGSGSQHSIGTGVVGGMLTATFMAVFFVPMFFVVITNLFSRKAKKADVDPQGEHA
ncbi:hydrophobe/amphiphile efflux-1 family RND transporter [Pseudomonas aeruginosa]|uniref:efflux RND transporter permease subunit n=1 Tax=Pseudomonas aeruginosa TaxID=287 RepID=UPI000FFE3490|nr:efflux RND transporter permease subunit [Pseudomonas aeruginosa]MBG4604160.1 efflux RND transporter permease subunit [Pseudomonas aeruginosa]MBH8257451.1 efflux RND transporter permease subunit [Pseudomonas aeruginosa]MCV3907758.1 efflux RND transporter permease subunit [Pseudomonas aeruginosa]NPS39666.1 efflux RND transporter permease subunit [Pseudomonas aeruginosa]NPS89138.1 efflux RND transporter permease subunit [Pseudomonas aeruginosa]